MRVVPGATDGTGTVVDNDSDDDGVCDADEVAGCQDSTACNYNETATDEGSCTYAEDYYDCDGNCLSDVDGDLVCDENEVAGCQDQLLVQLMKVVVQVRLIIMKLRIYRWGL